MSTVDFQVEMQAEQEIADRRMSVAAYAFAACMALFLLVSGWVVLVLLAGFQS